VTPSNPGYHIPSKPDIFVGRDTIVQEAVSQILKRRHVALIGAGGVGKSSIAKAIMHDERVVDHFESYRCFVTYSDVETSMMSYSIFLQHIADALSIPTATTLSTILATLRASPTLLVIDNAETFLDIDTVDGGHISDAIAELGGCSSVHLILTTRSGKLPNLSWFYQEVGGLDVEASRRLFSAVYKRDIGNRLDPLFSALDHHALSISLLSHTATRNAYQTTEEIQEAWEQQKTRLLKTGPVKSQNLGVTIEFSIDSPSLQGMKAVALAFLRIVAFLPEGVHRDDLLGIFPKATDIQAVVNTVCLSSLTYRSGERLTMLAPIRMYITDQYNANMMYQDPVLVSVRNYAYQQVFDDPVLWGVRESTNTERLLSFDLTSTHIQEDIDARLRILKSADKLILALQWHHPRETSLFPLLKSVSEERPRFQVVGVSVGRRSDKRLVLAKARCLIHICWLQYQLHRDFIKNDLLGTAESFCRSHMPTCTTQLVGCLRLKGAKYQQNGNLFLADEALHEASTLAHSLNDHFREALLDHNLSRVLFLRGNISEATSLMASAEDYFRSNNEHIHLVYLLLDRIYVLLYEKDFDTAREIFGQAEELDRKDSGGRKSRKLLNKKASVEGWAGNIATAMKILDEATRDEIRPGMLEFEHYVDAWRAKAYYAAIVGNFDDAHKFLAQAGGLAFQTGTIYLRDRLLAAYIAMYSGQWDRAKEHLESGLVLDTRSEVQFTGFIHRALGELALLQGRRDEAVVHFAEVESMCSTSGMAPRFLYANWSHCFQLSAEYDGWTRYLDGTL